MLRATYVGRELPSHLVGRTGIVRRHRCGLGKARELLIQFDDLDLGSTWTHAWWDVHALDLVLVSAGHDDATEDAEVRLDLRSWGAFGAWPECPERWASPRLREVLVGRLRPGT